MADITENKKNTGNASDLIYEQLRAKIIGLDIQPGLLISINELAQQFETGRTPVRDATIRLEQEGLITSLPQRGTMISKIDLNRVEAERFMRYSVEENVMGEFMGRCAPTDFLELESVIRRQQDCAAAMDVRGFMTADDEFHFKFYAATNRKLCADTLWSSSGHYQRIRLLSIVEGTRFRDVMQEHAEILTFLCARDMGALRDVFSRHLNKLNQQVHGLVLKYPDLFEQTLPEEKPRETRRTDFLKTLKREKATV